MKLLFGLLLIFALLNLVFLVVGAVIGWILQAILPGVEFRHGMIIGMLSALGSVNLFIRGAKAMGVSHLRIQAQQEDRQGPEMDFDEDEWGWKEWRKSKRS